MTDTPRPAAIFSDLASDPTTRAVILADAPLSVDDFADRHGPTIRQHYGKGGYQLDYETAHQAAARLWRYLREP